MKLFDLLDTTHRDAENFTKKFFIQVDKQKASRLVQDNASIVWNGNPLIGNQLDAMLEQGPSMKHQLTTLDVHPFPLGDTQAINMNVLVGGSVKFDNKYKDDFAFTAQMVVRRLQPRTPLVLTTMSYRLVHKPEKSELRT